MSPEKKPFLRGILERGVGGLYEARADEDGALYTLRARGIFRKQGRTPLVGDRVLFSPGQGEEHGWLEELLPRRNAFRRPPVANLDALAIVVAPEPQPDLLLVDRLLIWARQADVEVLLVFNKTDLNAEFLRGIAGEYTQAEATLCWVSAETGEGLEAMREALRGKLCCFAGQSAVGKSSLINALYGFSMPTGSVSRRTERGRHTTRHVQLLRHGETMVLDTPGFSLLELWPELPPEELADYYPEFEAYAEDCRFTPCQHDREPACAVRGAAEAGHLPKGRYDRYLQILEQVRTLWRGRYD